MHNISMTEALSIWSDLEQAYFKKNGYGGDTAEIYMYRFGYYPIVSAYLRHPHAPDDAPSPWIMEDIKKMNTSLFALLSHFAEHRDAEIEVDDENQMRPLGEWVKESNNTHRVHVRVTPKKRDPKK